MKSIEIFFRKFLLKLFLLFTASRTSDRPVILPDPLRILIIRLNRIGDALVATPFISELKRKINCEITVLADKKNYFIFERCESVDNVIVYKKGFASSLQIINQINTNGFNCVVDLHDDVSSTVTFLISRIKAEYKFGLKRNNKKIFTHTAVKPDPVTHHVIERNLSLLKLFGFSPENEEANISYRPKIKSLETAERYLIENFDPDQFTLGINISAGSEARFWGIGRFVKLIENSKQLPLNILLLTSPSDIEKAEQIAEKTRTQLFYSADFDIFAAMISKLDLLFSPDTSVVHIASAFRVPVFGLYVKYNTNDMIWSPYKSEFKYVMTQEPNLNNMNEEQVIPGYINFLKDIYGKKHNTKV